MGKTEAFQRLCNQMNKGFQSRQVPCRATYQGKEIQILHSSSTSQEVIESVFKQALNGLDYPYTIQKGLSSDWKVSFSKFERASVKLKEQIVQAVLKAAREYLNRHDGSEGIWYPDDYRRCLLQSYDIEMPHSMNSGYANDRYFNKIDAFAFVVKEGVRASEALLAFLKGPTVADCGNANTACWYKAVLDVIGKERFDRIFGSGPFALRIDLLGVNYKINPISLLSITYRTRKEHGSIGKRPLNVGDECHIGGVVSYGNKHPRGVWGGHNVFYVGDNEKEEQLFIGHGLSQPMTEREIMHLLVNEYNKERTPQDLQYIQQENKPHLYDRNQNVLLEHGYTLPLGMCMMEPEFYLNKYSSAHGRSLDGRAFALMMDEKDPIHMMVALQKTRLPH